MITLLFLSSALAAPAGYSVSDADYNGCELSLGPTQSDGFRAMHAECHWSDVTLAAFESKFADYSKHDDVFSTVAESKIQRTDASRTLVHQRHVLSSLSDREVLQWMEWKMEGDYRVSSWVTATGEPLTPASGNVKSIRSDGYWKVRTSEKGGVDVIYELDYNPGGSVPGFLVRWFQASGLQTTVDELHAYLK